jgi:hypothetical protein
LCKDEKCGVVSEQEAKKNNEKNKTAKVLENIEKNLHFIFRN